MTTTLERAETTAPIDSIKVGKRYRKDLGDLSGLKKSIQETGLLHPVVVNPTMHLVAGQRRLEAVRELGWTDVPVRIAKHLTEVRDLLIAERDENTCRKDMLPTERVDLGIALEDLERPKAAAQKHEGQKRGGKARHGQLDGNLPPSSRHQTREIVGETVGWSGKTYSSAKSVVQTADDESQPEHVREIAREAAKEMDETGKVTPAFEKVSAAKGGRNGPKHPESDLHKPIPLGASKRGSLSNRQRLQRLGDALSGYRLALESLTLNSENYEEELTYVVREAKGIAKAAERLRRKEAS